MKNIISTMVLALTLSFAFVSAYADNSYQPIVPGAAAIEEQITPPGAPEVTVKPEIDYSKNPVIAFDPQDWVQIGKDDKEKETYWLNIKTIEPDAQHFVLVGMILYDKDRIIQGVGTNVRRVFSEAIIECSNRVVYPLRDVYATVDFHLVSFHRHPMPQGMMFLDEVPMFKMYPDAKTKICPKK